MRPRPPRQLWYLSRLTKANVRRCQIALMSFNTDRCVALRLHPQQTKDSNLQYQLNGERLRCVSQQRAFDVILDDTLLPNYVNHE